MIVSTAPERILRRVHSAVISAFSDTYASATTINRYFHLRSLRVDIVDALASLPVSSALQRLSDDLTMISTFLTARKRRNCECTAT